MDERRRRRAFLLIQMFAVVSTFIIAVAHRRRRRRQERERITRAPYRQRGNWFMRDVVNGSDDKATGEYAQGSHTTATQPPAIVDICENSNPTFAPTVDLDGIDASVGDDAVVKRKERPSSSSKGKQPWKRSRVDDMELRELGSAIFSAIKDAGKELSRDREVERNTYVMNEVTKFGKQSGIGSRDLFSMGKVLLERPGDMKMFIAISDDDLRMTWLQIFYEDWCAGLY